MIRLCRAEDGEVFEVNVTVRDIERAGSLEFFLHQETGVDQEAILAYLSDGRRLRNDNIRELAGSQDQSIFIFNKYFLDLDLDDVLRELKTDAPLQPHIEDIISDTPPFRPSQLATSYLRAAHIHLEHIKHLSLTQHYQHEAVLIASSSLDLNALAITDAFESIAASSRRELEKQAALLAGLEADLEIISRVKIHVEFMSSTVRKAIESGEKPRTLGDYVSIVKMKQVAEGCTRTHEDLRSRFSQVEESVARLTEGAASIRATVTKTSILEDVEGCVRRSQELHEKITDTVAIIESPAANVEGLISELKQYDAALRDEVKHITDAKNAYTELCISSLRRVSTLNTDLVQLPPLLSNLQAGFRGKNSFSHIQRLHNMLYAYGATVIEIVRRKEFARFFYHRAQSILEIMAKLSVSERKRRQVYRGEVQGQLPFDTKGMDDPVPSIDFSPSGGMDAPYSLEREDVDGIFRVLDELEQFAQSNNDPLALGAISEARTALEKLVIKMDSLESGFDRIAERSLLSSSRLLSSRRRSMEADEHAYQEMMDLLHEAQASKQRQEASFRQEREDLHREISRLKSSHRDREVSLVAEQERTGSLERQLHHARAQTESEIATRKILETRNEELSSELTEQRKTLAAALADATEQTKIAEVLREELAQVRAEAEEVKTLEARNVAKVAALVEEQAITLRKLEEARVRGEDLESQIRSARTESEGLNQALKESSEEKDRLLHVQASEHDRIIRDHIAEAVGNRAVLEHQNFELKAMQEDTELQLKDALSQAEIANADAVGLREELQRVEHELREARHAERVLRDDLKAGRASQSDYEQRLENHSRLIAQILDVAIAFRNSHVKALNMSRTMTSPSAIRSSSIGDSMFSTVMHHGVIGPVDEPSPIDPSDPSSALELLRSFDHDHFLEAITKVGTVIRKWQKQCKEYRERAKGKISFRNFTKGDLALFLPTRNSVSKPWAAFNVSFPHYFLQATGHLEEQLKTREWIVARITSIAEHVVDANDPESNPFGLGDGVKYYMLEVEDWTQSSHSNKRRSSSKKTSDKEMKDSTPGPFSPLTLHATPPRAEVEEPFRTAPPVGSHLTEDSFDTTLPPTSHLFPVRSRSNSSPNAGPSSLSRLLAQASVDTTPEAIPPEPLSPPPPPSPLPPSSPTRTASVLHGHVPNIPSPLRPGSRASRLSTSSKFSAGRIPPLGSASSLSSAPAKTPPTTALSDHQGLSIPSSVSSNAFAGPVPPSPDGSVTQGLSNIASNRRRTSSYHMPQTPSHLGQSTGNDPASVNAGGGSAASNTLASLATSFGVSFGRRKRAGVERPVSADSSTGVQGNIYPGSESSAHALLKRF